MSIEIRGGQHSIGADRPIICHLTDFGSTSPGSFIDALVFLALHCRARMGKETFCVFPEHARGNAWIKRFEEQGIVHGFVPKGRSTVLSLRMLLQRYQPLIIHSHFFTDDIAAVVLKLLLAPQSKVIWHLHSPGELSLRQRWKDVFKVRLLARLVVDRFIAAGEGAYANAVVRGFSRKKLVLIPNGIDVGRFRPDPATRHRIRESLGVTQDQLVYLLLGWDPYTKGVDLFVKAAHETAHALERPSLFLVIGEARTREFVGKLPESARLGSALRIVDPVTDFASFLSAVDVVVSASRREGFGYAVAEGMAAGKLILLSDIPGARKTFGGSRGVWLFGVEDWMTQAACMKTVGELSFRERETLGAANSGYVTDRYSLTQWADTISNLYQNLLV